MRSRSPSVLVLLAFLAGATGGDAAAVKLSATRLTDNATWEWGVSVAGTKLYWAGVDPDGVDYEIFRFDATLAIDAGAPARCPLSNPCQLSENDFDDTAPLASTGGVAWRSRPAIVGPTALWVARGDVPEQVGWIQDAPAAIDGDRLVWLGSDLASTPGVHLADLGRPFDAEPAACPETNPCRIADDEPGVWIHGPAIDGTRIAWTDAVAGEDDTEVFFFDAALAVDAGPPGACFETNPCRLTDDDVGDAGVAISESLIAWVSCADANCVSEPPDALHVFDGVQTLDFQDTSQYKTLFSDFMVVDGTRIAWVVFLQGTIVLDASLPIDPFASLPAACPDANPCQLPGATGSPAFLGRYLLGSNGSDVPGPFDLLLFEPAAPPTPGPPIACPGGNPCVVRNGVLASAASTELIAWSGCGDPEQAVCADEETEVWVMPEAEGALLACLVLAARRLRRR